MEIIKKKPIILFPILLIVLYVLIYVVPGLSGALQSTYTVEYGTLSTYDDATGYIIRDESVYVAVSSGTQNRYIEDGKLVRKGTKILEVIEPVLPEADAQTGEGGGTGAQTNGAQQVQQPAAVQQTQQPANAAQAQQPAGGTQAQQPAAGVDAQSSAEQAEQETGNDKYKNILQLLGDDVKTSKKYKTKSEGVVTYAVDGYENSLVPEKRYEMNEKTFKGINNGDVVLIDDGETVKGDPVFKIADRANWYIICFVPEEHAERYEQDARVSVVMDGLKTISGILEDCTLMDGKARLIIRSSYYYEDFARVRISEVKVITSEEMGLIIENESITEKDGQKGVYVRQTNGEYEFKPIQIIASDDTKSVITGSVYRDAEGNSISTVKSYDEVLRKGN